MCYCASNPHALHHQQLDLGEAPLTSIISENATVLHLQIWRWISDECDFLRLATFHGIAWIALVSAVTIYCLAFRKVWHHRHELKGFFYLLNEDLFAGIITTGIEITRTSRPRLSSTSGNFPGPVEEIAREDFDPYTIDIGVGSQAEMSRPNRPDVFRLGSLTRNAALSETNPDAWLYARVAFLYFCALLISWYVLAQVLLPIRTNFRVPKVFARAASQAEFLGHVLQCRFITVDIYISRIVPSAGDYCRDFGHIVGAMARTLLHVHI